MIPAILAPLASAVALLLRPRELVQMLRRRPGVAVGIVVAIGAAWWGLSWWLGAWATGTKADNPAVVRIDWVKEAKEIIEREQAGGAAATTKPVEVARDSAVVFRYGFARQGYDGGPVPLALRRNWAYQPDGAMCLSSPAVRGNCVYSASAIVDPIDGNSGTVFCLNAASGKPIWSAGVGIKPALKPFFSSPAVTADGKYVVIGQGLHDDENSDLICFEAETGKVHWRIRTPLHIEGSPAIHGDMAVAGAGAIEGPDHKPKPGTNPGFVLAVRISDGKELWRYQVNDPESSPAVGKDGTVYIGSGFNGNAVVALRSETDEELKAKGLERLVWRTPTPYPATGAVTLIDDLVIVGAGNGDYVVVDPHPAGVVLAMDAKSGTVRWEAPMPDAVLGAVAAGDGKVICPVRSGEVAALNLSDGSKLWQQRVSENSPVLAAPAFTGKYVYAVSKDGYLAILDAADGRRIERHYLNDESNPGAMGLTLSSPIVAGGRVIVGSETGGLRCFIGGKNAP